MANIVNFTDKQFENRLNDNLEELVQGKKAVELIGHYRYYGISHNGRMISCFRQRTIDFLYKILNRRSHKKSYTVEGFKEMLKVYKLPYPKIYISLFDWK